MRGWTKWTAAVLGGLLGAAMAVPTAAYAGPGVDDVVASLGLTSEPADYVVLVDTSGSMNAAGRYSTVRSELGKLVAGLDADDRVSLLTFDTKVAARFRGVVGKHPGAVLAKLPRKAAGKHTDIGAAIAAGLSELEKPDTHRQVALILITDGKVDAPGSAYASPKSTAWKALQHRATALASNHQVAAYAVALQKSTDAGLLKQAFPQAAEVNAGHVGARFAQVAGDLLRLQAAQVLKDELAQPITVTWAGDLGRSLADGVSVPVKLTFTSRFPHVPIELSRLGTLATDGLHVQLSGAPETIEIDPNQSVTVPMQAMVTGTSGWGADVGLSATVDSTWRQVLTDDLGVDLAPAIVGRAHVPVMPIKVPPALLMRIVMIGAALAAVILVLWLVRAVTSPPMNGLLSIRRGDRVLADIPVDGRRMKVIAPAAATELQGLTGSVAGRRVARGAHGVKVELRFGSVRARGLLADGSALEFGDMTVVFISKRRRILDKIGFPVEGAVDESGPDEQPAGAAEPVVAEELAETSEADVAEESVLMEEPAPVEEPATPEESIGAGESAAVKASDVVEELAEVAEQAAVDEPDLVDESAEVDDAAPAEEPTQVDESVHPHVPDLLDEWLQRGEPDLLDRLIQLDESNAPLDPGVGEEADLVAAGNIASNVTQEGDRTT